MRTIEKLIWLLNALSRKPMTLSEISSKWENEASNEEHAKLPPRTFARWRDGVEHLFGVFIKCNGFNEYYIEESYSTQDQTLKNWLVQTYSINTMLNGNTNLRSRVIFDRVPSGEEHLVPIIDAMQNNAVLTISYKGFGKPEAKVLIVEPYLVKQVNRRWYMLARDTQSDMLIPYSLDRIKSVISTDRSFSIPRNFNPDTYFDGIVGITKDENTPIQKIRIKASVPHRDYLLTLPIHDSQLVVEEYDDYSILEYEVRPTFEFFQQILMGGDMVEILSPDNVRETAREWIVSMEQNYDKKEP